MKYFEMKDITFCLVVMMGITAYSNPAVAAGYVGIGAGQATIDVCGDARNFGATRCDDEDTGFKIYGGYEFLNYLAVEGSYADYGEIEASAPGFAVSADATALAVTARLTWDANDVFSLFGRLGYARWETDISVTGVGSADDDGGDVTYGVGAQYSLTNVFDVQAEWERTELGSDDVDFLSLGLTCRF